MHDMRSINYSKWISSKRECDTASQSTEMYGTPHKNNADVQEYKSLMKSCIGTSIFIQSLVKQLSDDTDVYKGKTVAVDFKYHPRFGIVKIVDTKSRSSK